MNVLVLGGNGFIGFEIVSRLLADGHKVCSIGRNIDATKIRLPDAEWLKLDISSLLNSSDWQTLIADVDVVINCAGALQDSARDDVNAVQLRAMSALYEAATQAGSIRIVQISANLMSGTEAGNTDFLNSKNEADKLLSKSELPFVILRPALVVGRNCHGGSALLRAAAAMPLAIPVFHGNSSCQTTDMSDLVTVIIEAAQGKHGKDGDYSVASEQVYPLRDVVGNFRSWLGLPTVSDINVPANLARLGAVIADIAGWLGWRSPMRTTALTVLEHGIIVNSDSPLIKTRSLKETLAENPAGIQDIWHARLYLLKPVFILTLSAFWIASGVIALFNIDEAKQYLSAIKLSDEHATMLIISTAILDGLLGILILSRTFAKVAIVGMVALSLAYLAGASLFLPNLWLDPIGPLVKIIPGILLSIAGLAVLDER